MAIHYGLKEALEIVDAALAAPVPRMELVKALRAAYRAGQDAGPVDDTDTNYAHETAKLFAHRAESLGLKGKNRDALGLEFFIGASQGFQLAGKKDAADHLVRVAAFLVAMRGYKEIEALAAKAE